MFDKFSLCVSRLGNDAVDRQTIVNDLNYLSAHVGRMSFEHRVEILRCCQVIQRHLDGADSQLQRAISRLHSHVERDARDQVTAESVRNYLANNYSDITRDPTHQQAFEVFYRIIARRSAELEQKEMEEVKKSETLVSRLMAAFESDDPGAVAIALYEARVSAKELNAPSPLYKTGRTALKAAIYGEYQMTQQHHRLKIVTLLLQAGADPNQEANDKNALLVAIEIGDLHVFQLLHSYGGRFDLSTLKYAIQKDAVDIVGYLMDQLGIKANARIPLPLIEIALTSDFRADRTAKFLILRGAVPPLSFDTSFRWYNSEERLQIASILSADVLRGFLPIWMKPSFPGSRYSIPLDQDDWQEVRNLLFRRNILQMKDVENLYALYWVQINPPSAPVIGLKWPCLTREGETCQVPLSFMVGESLWFRNLFKAILKNPETVLRLPRGVTKRAMDRITAHFEGTQILSRDTQYASPEELQELIRAIDKLDILRLFPVKIEDAAGNEIEFIIERPRSDMAKGPFGLLWNSQTGAPHVSLADMTIRGTDGVIRENLPGHRAVLLPVLEAWRESDGPYDLDPTGQLLEPHQGTQFLQLIYQQSAEHLDDMEDISALMNLCHRRFNSVDQLVSKLQDRLLEIERRENATLELSEGPEVAIKDIEAIRKVVKPRSDIAYIQNMPRIAQYLYMEERTKHPLRPFQRQRLIRNTSLQLGDHKVRVNRQLLMWESAFFREIFSFDQPEEAFQLARSVKLEAVEQVINLLHGGKPTIKEGDWDAIASLNRAIQYVADQSLRVTRHEKGVPIQGSSFATKPVTRDQFTAAFINPQTALPDEETRDVQLAGVPLHSSVLCLVCDAQFRETLEKSLEAEEEAVDLLSLLPPVWRDLDRALAQKFAQLIYSGRTDQLATEIEIDQLDQLCRALRVDADDLRYQLNARRFALRLPLIIGTAEEPGEALAEPMHIGSLDLNAVKNQLNGLEGEPQKAALERILASINNRLVQPQIHLSELSKEAIDIVVAWFKKYG